MTRFPLSVSPHWLAVVLVAAAACSDIPTRPVPYGSLALRPMFQPGADLAALGLSVDVVRVLVSRDTGAVLDSTVPFSPNVNEITLAFEVPLESIEETVEVLLELRAGSLTLFRGTQRVLLRHDAGSQEPVEIPLQYEGPGANIAGLAISPRAPFVLVGDSLQLSVAAVDSQQAPVATFYVGWLASDPTLVSIDAHGLIRAAGGLEGSLWVRARTPTGIADSVPVVVTVGGQGRIVGTVRDAASGGPVGGATVDVRAGSNATLTDPVVRSSTTDAAGGFTLDALTPGDFTLFAQHTAYLPTRVPNIALAPGEKHVISLSLSPPLAAGQTRIVLSWGAMPDDLDTYLEVPDTLGGAPFVVYYSNPGDPQVYPFAQLDVDVTSGFGPETMTIYQQLAGPYTYHVHDFTTYQDASSTALAGSGARVEVYQNNQLVRTFTVPNQPGSLWTVFQLDGTTITPINRLSGNLPPVGGASRTDIDAPGPHRSKVQASR